MAHKPGEMSAHDAHYFLAKAHFARGENESALSALDQALAARPDFPEALDAKALLLARMERHEESVAAARLLQSLRPSRAAALTEASGLSRLGRHDEALEAAARVLKLSPEPGEWRQLAAIHSDARFAVEALEMNRRAIAADPQDLRTRSLELFFGNFDENARGEDLYRRHREYGALIEARVAPVFRKRWLGTRDAGRRLRVGIVSPDLCQHPVALFLQPLLERIDRSAFEVWCYSSVTQPDAATAALRAQSAAWVEATALSDEQLAARIHADGIDVLLDLAGHSGTPRLAVFAQEPAPVQIAWLGYLNTTGLTRIGWRLCDERTDPEPTQRLHTEKLLPFAASQWCYRPFADEPVATQPPCVANGFVTFGSFNNSGKLSEAMCERWARVMLRCPGSRMVIADVRSQAKRCALAQAFQRQGVDETRLTFEPHLDVASYYRLFAKVDIGLDSYPYGGGTTTLDTLWMGVPVFTLKGELPVSRSAASVLELLGLDDWIAHSPEAYVEQAAARAADLQAIVKLRAQLRGLLKDSPLTDEAGFTRAFERALRTAWEKHCAAGRAGPAQSAQRATVPAST